jgi:predicted DNA-binding transcriptional regulator AlpA
MPKFHPALVVEVLREILPDGWEIREVQEGPVEELLTGQQLADELHLSIETVRRYIRDGTGPLATKVPGHRSPMFKRKDVEAWKARLKTARNTLELKTG